MSVTKLLAISLGAILTNNFIFSQFLGICPFLGVSKKSDTAIGMGPVSYTHLDVYKRQGGRAARADAGRAERVFERQCRAEIALEPLRQLVPSL